MYQYTNNDLISQKKVPGKAYEAYEYNSRDLVVRYQDPILRATSGRWMGSKYDSYGRLTEKGVWLSGAGDAVVLSNKIIENIYGTVGVELDKIKTTKVQAFTAGDPVANLTAANPILQTTFNYDTYGRIASTTGNNHTNTGSLTAESVTYGYDHGDNILTQTRVSNSSAGTVNIVNSRQFDTWGRLAQTSQNLNSTGDKIISQLAYTDRDQVLWKKLGGGLQQIDYTYLPNGFLADINGSVNLTASTYPVSSMLTNLNTPTFTANNNGDLFREMLRYNNATNPTGGLFGTVQQNGNVGLVYWQVKGRANNAYGLTYDHLDRLTAARHTAYTATGTLDPVDYFGENMAYDARGNIISINRKGLIKGATNYTAATIDNRTVTIPAGSNLPSQTNGTSSTPAANVNMDVPHNYLNLPTKFDFGSNDRIELIYDGLGNKLRKTVFTNNVVTLTQDYLGGIELKNNKVDAVYNEEGRAFNTAASGQTYRYEYVLRDHLGNTRVVFTDKGAVGIQDNTEILSEIHYYPFGRALDGAWYNDAAASKYKYLYSGKELNDEFNLNFYDFGARWLDPSIGSWWEVDPMAEIYERWSPMTYVFNNPISWTDPDGRCPTCPQGDDASAIYAPGAIVTNQYGSWTWSGSEWQTNSTQSVPAGERVMTPVSGFLGWADQLMNGNRSFAGREVNSNGILLNQLKPMMGLPPDIGMGKVNAIKDLKSVVSKVIHWGKQGKHILGHNNFKLDASVLNANAQELLDAFHEGNIISTQVINEVKTRVDFGKVIGNYVNSGVSMPTTKGIIINSKSGVHIVPSAPN
jgi:RHS repeat-associated protein